MCLKQQICDFTLVHSSVVICLLLPAIKVLQGSHTVLIKNKSFLVFVYFDEVYNYDAAELFIY